MRVLSPLVSHSIFEVFVDSIIMYGQIHCVIREMVQVKFGMEKWGEVLNISAMNEDIHFLVFSVYDDASTFRLFDTVSRVVGIPYDTTLREFGTYFLTYCMKHGYDKMLLTLGQDLFTFVQNLDSLHSMLALSYRGIVAPSFRCVEKADGTMIIHHYSWRNGFYPIVQGVLEAVGRDLFDQVATVSFIDTVQLEVADGKYQYHTMLKVELRSRARGNMVSLDRGALTLEKLARRRMTIRVTDVHREGSSSIMTVGDLVYAFPYNILLDSQLYVLECGDAIRRFIPFHISSDIHFSDIATIRQPVMSATVDRIINFINSIFIIDLVSKANRKPFQLKGQMMWLPYSCHIMFVGSPRLQNLDEFKETRTFFSDLQLYDNTRELVLLNQQRKGEIEKATKLDQTTVALRALSKDLEQEKQKTEQLLLEMMPQKIADQLYEQGVVTPEKHEMSTVLFSSIVTFADIVWTCSADEVVSMLNDLYHRCDTAADRNGVYKVETIGDAYMAATGLPEAQEDHMERMADFAMDMLEDADYIQSPATGHPLQIKVGFNSGSLVAGVIGKKKPRYDIYGDTVNVAARMCGSSVPGRIHVTGTVFEKLYKCGYIFKNRGEVELKGKGKMITYFLVGSEDRDIYQPDDVYTFLPDLFVKEEAADEPALPHTGAIQPTATHRAGDKHHSQHERRASAWRKLSVNTRALVPAHMTTAVRQSDAHKYPGLSPPSLDSVPEESETISQDPSGSSVAQNTDILTLPPISGDASPAISLQIPFSVQCSNAVASLDKAGTRLRGKATSPSLPQHHQQTWELTPRMPTAASVRTAPVPGHLRPTSPADIILHKSASVGPRDSPASANDLPTSQVVPPDRNESCRRPPATVQPIASDKENGEENMLRWQPHSPNHNNSASYEKVRSVRRLSSPQ